MFLIMKCLALKAESWKTNVILLFGVRLQATEKPIITKRWRKMEIWITLKKEMLDSIAPIKLDLQIQ